MSWWDPKVAARLGRLHVPLGSTPAGGEVVAVVPGPPATIREPAETYRIAAGLYEQWARSFTHGPPLPGRLQHHPARRAAA